MRHLQGNWKGQGMKIPDISKMQIIALMEQWIIGRNAERNKAIFYDRLFRGRTYEQLAETFDMSPRQIQNIIKFCEKKVFTHVPG